MTIQRGKEYVVSGTQPSSAYSSWENLERSPQRSRTERNYAGEYQAGYDRETENVNFIVSKPRVLTRQRSHEQSSRRNRRQDGGRKRKRHWSEKLLDALRSFIAFLFSNVGIVCLVVGYTLAGAFIFRKIEGGRVVSRINVSAVRHTTVVSLWQLTTEENTFSKETWTDKVNKTLVLYQGTIIKAVKSDGYDGKDYQEEDQKWEFAGAFLYSLTVITTIGYGNTCPKTMWGKVVTIVYAIFGMPLFLLYLSNIGDILARSFKWTYARCCLCRCRKKPRISSRHDSSGRHNAATMRSNTWQMVRMHDGQLDTTSLSGADQDSVRSTSENEDQDEDDDDDDEEDDDDDDDDEYDPQHITVPLTLCLAIMVGYICGGAKLFAKWENWNFLDGSYFCFVSLSTIGFGDIVPGTNIYAGQGLALSSVFCSMYLMLGMALIAMCFNLMQEEVVAKIRTFTRSVKHLLSCKN